MISGFRQALITRRAIDVARSSLRPPRRRARCSRPGGLFSWVRTPAPRPGLTPADDLVRASARRGPGLTAPRAHAPQARLRPARVQARRATDRGDSARPTLAPGHIGGWRSAGVRGAWPIALFRWACIGGDPATFSISPCRFGESDARTSISGGLRNDAGAVTRAVAAG